MSSNGIRTAYWGPHAWNFLFSSVIGAYPVRYDSTNKDHQKKVKGFAQMFNSLASTLPCIYCRQSYAAFLKELPMKDYMGSRMSMMRWLYLIHDKVNQKLIKQERECYQTEQIKLKEMMQTKKITAAKYKQELAKLKLMLITKPSPPFEKVVAKYEKERAGCNPKNKKCA